VSDFIDELERELRAAGRRRLRLAFARVPRPSRATTAAASGLRALPVALAVLLAITIAVVALIEVGHSPRRPAASPTAHSRQELIDTLGVLRRPQTKADLGLDLSRFSSFLSKALAGAPDLSLVRLATTTPWGQRIFLVPLNPPTAKAVATLESSRPARPLLNLLARNAASRGETLRVFSGHGLAGGATAASVEAQGFLEIDGTGRSVAGRWAQTRFLLVVPDGVAKVVFVVPRQPAGAQPGAPIYKHSLRVAVAVHDNVAAVQVDRQTDGRSSPMIWYAASGRLIKRIGNLASANRVTVPAKPGPETSLSRAAQRDPSTPNRVWVTPRTGGPHTQFRIHFRILLSDAHYRYKFSGTRCPQFTFPGGTGGGYNDLRGELWSDALGAPEVHALCPGTYHVTVAVMQLGRYGMRPARPFGSATYTVKARSGR
jgi:hypothetical protein